MNISKFNSIKEITNGVTIGILQFLGDVKTGAYSGLIDTVKKEKDKKKRQKLKSSILPYVTISGTFEPRKDEGLIKHSGFICMDIDGIEDVDDAFSKIKDDPYTYSVFRSASGNGLAIIVKINPKKHLDSFKGLEVHYISKYGFTVDKSCKNVSRARYVSSDPRNNSKRGGRDIQRVHQRHTAKSKKKNDRPRRM